MSDEPRRVVVGTNELVGNFTAQWNASAAAGTVVNVPVPLPDGFSKDANYLVSVNNPASLGTGVTLNFQNAINFGSGNVWCSAKSSDVATGTAESFVVQGWLLGDGGAQIHATNDAAASTSGGTVQIQVRKL